MCTLLSHGLSELLLPSKKTPIHGCGPTTILAVSLSILLQAFFFRKADVTNALPGVMQFSRHALARAYMTLFSSSMSQVYPLSQFTDLFSKSSGNMNNLQDFPVPDLISEFNIHLPRDPKGKGKEKTYEAGQLERRMGEYEQKVLTRLIADEESLKWIEDETRLLREVIVTNPSHLAEL